MEASNIDFSKLLKAQAVFERFRQNMQDDRDQAGAVQAFEFCYELAWKMMKRVLATQGVEAASPRDTFRKAAVAKLIDDPEVWFDFLDKRNFSIDSCEQESLWSATIIFESFSLELSKLIQHVQFL